MDAWAFNPISFVEPLWLVGLALPVAMIALAVRARRRGAGPTIGILIGQCLAVTLVVLALAQPLWRGPAAAAAEWLVLRDVSASVATQDNGPLVSETVSLVDQPFAGRLVAPGQPIEPMRTAIGPALSLASLRADTVVGAILLTDGCFEDDWESAARRLAAKKRPLWIVPLDAPVHDARVVSLRVRPRPGGACEIEATVQANTLCQRDVTIQRASGPGGLLYEKSLRLSPGRPVTIRLTDLLPAGVEARYTARIGPADAIPANDAITTLLPPRRRLWAWVARAGSDAPAGFANAAGVSLVNASPCDDVAGWFRFSAVCLVDPTGGLLTQAQRRSVAAYVRAGGGLVLVGTGPRETPGDQLDPLNRVAALVPNPFTRQPIALTVVLDASGSMAASESDGQRRFDLASQGVSALKTHLTAKDDLEVIVFAAEAKRIYNSQSASGGVLDFGLLADALAKVQPNGPTNIAPALALAATSSAREGQTKLVLVVSDLETSPFDPAKVATTFKKNRWALAVVTTGSPGPSSPLATLAKSLDAPVVRGESLRDLARIFAKLCRQARGVAVRTGSFRVTLLDAAAALESLASLKKPMSFVPCAVSRDAEVLARIGPGGDALLATRSIGLGKVASLVLTSNSSDPRLAKVFADLGQRVALPAARPGVSGYVEQTPTAMQVHITLDPSGRNAHGEWPDLQLERVGDPARDEAAASIALRQVGVGEYRATLPASSARGAMQVVERTTGELYWRGAMTFRYPAEVATLGADYESLRRLAALTGGTILSRDALTRALAQGGDALAQGSDGARPAGGVGMILWPGFLMGATGIMLAIWLWGHRVSRRRVSPSA